MNEPNRNALDCLAVRVSADPFFLGSALAAYQRRHGLDDEGLASVLGCAPDVLTHLRLCRKPGAAEPARSVADDLAEIAGRFGIDAAVLRCVVEDDPSGH